MKNKLVSLYDLIKLKDDEELSEKYIRYIAGLSENVKYRHAEINDISVLINELQLSNDKQNGYIYGYEIPQLNKQFDLLKITENACLNIELKSQHIGYEKVLKQLRDNRHFLKMLKKTTICVTFISSTKEFFLLENDSLRQIDIDEAKTLFIEEESIDCDLDAVFSAKNIFVSPLNTPAKFLKGEYLLTENQENIKKQILKVIDNSNKETFIGLTGGYGTGKTLLVYDIAKQLSQNNKVLIIHSGIICEGQTAINKSLTNCDIISAKKAKPETLLDYKYVIVDESQRLFNRTKNIIINHIGKINGVCIFSFDPMQKLSNSEENRNTVEDIKALCRDNVFKLTNTIRTNKNLSIFIDCLFNLGRFKDSYAFENVQIRFEPNEKKAVEIAKNLQGFKYISYTPSEYHGELDYQIGNDNTHRVIGQEFDNVVMVINSYFFYSGNTLKSHTHPNPDYILTKLLYQGLTRARNKITLIITKAEVLDKVLSLFINVS